MDLNPHNDQEKSSFLSVGYPKSQKTIGHSTADLTITTLHGGPREEYLDLEELNTSVGQVKRRKELLSMNVEKLKRKRRKNPKIDMYAPVCA